MYLQSSSYGACTSTTASTSASPLTAGVGELEDVLAVVLVHAPYELAPERGAVVAVDQRVAWQQPPARVHGSVRRDDRSDSAARGLEVPVDASLGPGAVVVVPAPAGARPEDPVLDRQVSEAQRLEDRTRAHGRTVRLRPPTASPSSLAAGILRRLYDRLRRRSRAGHS